ncbi:MAG TPA: hypothetical protein VM782_10590 [Stellaceae bacterium]|nr:hypothetical protein [Stellaceae bacterium]
MAKTALTQLQDQIEAIRREAYQAGYAAAMQAIREFSARPTAGAAPAAARPAPRRPAAAKATPAPAAKPAAPRRRGRAAAKAPVRTSGSRPQRGTNARLIAEVLKAMPSGTARPAEIRSALQRDKGVQMAFTSIRHALGQLASRNEVAASDDGKIWRYVGGAS